MSDSIHYPRWDGATEKFTVLGVTFWRPAQQKVEHVTGMIDDPLEAHRTLMPSHYHVTGEPKSEEELEVMKQEQRQQEADPKNWNTDKYVIHDTQQSLSAQLKALALNEEKEFTDVKQTSIPATAKQIGIRVETRSTKEGKLYVKRTK